MSTTNALCSSLMLFFLFCIQTITEIDILNDQKENPLLGTRRDTAKEELMYCYKKQQRLYVTEHIKQHILSEMKHSSFVLTIQLKFKSPTIPATVEHTLLSIEELNRGKLFRWWVNLRGKKVGLVYKGKNNRDSSIVFNNVALDEEIWVQLTMRFRRVTKKRRRRLIVDFYVNTKKMATKSTNSFVNEIFTVSQRRMNIFLGDKGVRSFYSSKGKVRSCRQSPTVMVLILIKVSRQMLRSSRAR